MEINTEQGLYKLVFLGFVRGGLCIVMTLLDKFIESQFINRQRNMLNWKCVYFIEIGNAIKS